MLMRFIAIILSACMKFLFTGLLKERYITMSEHEHDCGCGCGHDHEHDHDHMNVTLTLDDGTDLECEVLCIFPVGEKDYIALIPAEREEEEDGEIFLYQFIEHENDEIIKLQRTAKGRKAERAEILPVKRTGTVACVEIRRCHRFDSFLVVYAVGPIFSGGF